MERASMADVPFGISNCHAIACKAYILLAEIRCGVAQAAEEIGLIRLSGSF
jgi:hypothetical protein